MEQEKFSIKKLRNYAVVKVEELLDKDSLDYTELIGVFIDDGGNCLHFSFTGGVELHTLVEIGKLFDDDLVNVYAMSEGARGIRLIVMNNLPDDFDYKV